MKENTIIYKQKATSKDVFRYVKAVIAPVCVLVLSFITITNFAGFGTKIIAPLTGIMWAVGAICAIVLPSQRQVTLNETHATIAVYLIGLSLLRHLIALISGVSSEMLMSAIGQAVPLTGGSTISGWLQTVMWITAVMTPFGFVTMQGKKMYSLKKKGNKIKVLAQLRNIRDDNYDHTNS